MGRAGARQLRNIWLPRIRSSIAVIALGLAAAALLSRVSLRLLPAIFLCGTLYFLLPVFEAGKERKERVYFFIISALCAGIAYITAVSLW